LGVEKAVLFNTHEDGLTEAEAVRRLEKFGKNQLPEKEDNKLMKLAMEFVQPMPLMIWAAIFIEVRAPTRDARRRARDPPPAAAAARGQRGDRAAR
jgi:magnesium-transporting ATPase (P-type)